MPRIPQGQFNNTPSTRVGARKVIVPKDTGVDKAIDATTKITLAMAKLEDQSERADAYNSANEVQDGYKAMKTDYLQKLESADADGNYSFQDPLSEDGKVIEGNIRGDMKDMDSYYNKGQQKLAGLTRADIAVDLGQQYVGDDLKILQVKTGKFIARKKQHKLKTNALQNMEMSVVPVLDLASTGGSPEVMEATLAQSINKLDREIAMVGQNLGTEGTASLTQYRDKVLMQTAQKLIGNKLDATSLSAADKMISAIRDPNEKASAQLKIEGIKKQRALEHDRLAASSVQQFNKDFSGKDFVDGKDMIAAKQTLDKVKNSYYDPEYSAMEPEQKDELVFQLESTIFSKYMTQEGLDASIEDLSVIEEMTVEKMRVEQEAAGQQRSPSAEEMAKVTELDTKLNSFLERSLASSGVLDKDMPKERKMRLFDLAKQSIIDNYSNFGETAVETHAAKNPEELIAERVVRLDAKGETLSAGDMTYVTKQESKVFTNKLTGYLKENRPDKAFNELNKYMQGLDDNHSRAVASDLVKGNPKLEYLIPASDFMAAKKFDIADQIINDAHTLQTTEKIFGEKKGKTKALSDTDFQAAFDGQAEGTGLNSLRVQDANYKSGQKKAILNRAKVLMLEGEEDNVKDAMQASLEYFGRHSHSIDNNDVGQLSIVMTKSNIDFDKFKSGVANGAGLFHRTLPTLSAEDKKYIALNHTRDLSASKGTEATINLSLRNSLRLETHPRKVNVYRLVGPNGKAVTRKDRTEIEYTADQMYDAIQSGKTSKEDLEDGIKKGQMFMHNLGKNDE